MMVMAFQSSPIFNLLRAGPGSRARLLLDDRFLETDQGTDDWLADSSFAIV